MQLDLVPGLRRGNLSDEARATIGLDLWARCAVERTRLAPWAGDPRIDAHRDALDVASRRGATADEACRLIPLAVSLRREFSEGKNR